ncbi:MAG: peptidase T [Massiliimalia sp.]|jgi:tripeptide aminopeptidase
MRAYERFLQYIQYDTTADPQADCHPSNPKEFNLANALAEEMKQMGLTQVRVSDTCYVYGMLPATPGMEHCTPIGFIAHMDTAADASGTNIHPQIIENYAGQDVPLGTSGLSLTSQQFPHLAKLTGRTLITTDGTTLLGADDKAGVAEIMTACEMILKNQIPHGPICVGFTSDEEVGGGADFFDVPGFGAKYAYTVDGGEEGELEYENFNAADAVCKINGVSIHPGGSKNKMKNASLIAMEFNTMLPAGDTPAHTEGYEGFFHLTHMEGDVTHASLSYIIRDHDRAKFEARKDCLRHIAKLLNEKYGENSVELTITDSYYNMKEALEPCMHLIDNAKKAIESLGIEPIIVPIRGGTDGSRLSYMGLPCPNLGTGGYGAHGPFEHITAEGMDACTNILVEIIKSYAQ